MDDTRTKSWWIGLTAEEVLGVVFVLAAALKALDLEAFAFQIRYYQILKAPQALAIAAVASVAVYVLGSGGRASTTPMSICIWL